MNARLDVRDDGENAPTIVDKVINAMGMEHIWVALDMLPILSGEGPAIIFLSLN